MNYPFQRIALFCDSLNSSGVGRVMDTLALQTNCGSAPGHIGAMERAYGFDHPMTTRRRALLMAKLRE